MTRILKIAVPLFVTALLSAAFFFACYRLDNKYTTPGPRAMAGILLLDEETLERYPVTYLVWDWEIYRDKLLAPDDFKDNAPLPDELVFIGQYGGFEGNEQSGRSPHGSATYRLNIFLPPEARSYTLELPEIYSAYRLYINGELTAGMGEPNPDGYRPQTGNRSVTVRASERIEILFAVSDYSYIYSGMVYPPAFGETEAVAKLLNHRLFLRSAVTAAALCIGLLSLCVWLLARKEREPLYYAALCVCFILYTCYPVVKTLWTAGMWWYTVENLAYCAMPLLVILIQRPLTDLPAKWIRPFACLTFFVCGWSVAVPLFFNGKLALMTAYSGMLEFTAAIGALYLTAGAVYAAVRGAARNRIMLMAITAYDAALIMERLLPAFEPVRFGWFGETGGAVLVVVTGYVMAADIANRLRLRQAVENRAELVSKMLAVQNAYFPALLKKEEETKNLRHDLRHHISVIKQLHSEGGGKLSAYLDGLTESRVRADEPVVYCEHPIVNTLLWMYGGLAKEQDTRFFVRASLPQILPVVDADLCVVISNLLENALEAVKNIPPIKRSVTVNIGREPDGLGILIKNPFEGELMIRNGRFLSSKQTGREGVGLASVKSVCKSYGGYASFTKDENGNFRSEAFIPLPNGGHHANSDL